METKENELSPLGVCHRLFNMILSTLAFRGFRRGASPISSTSKSGAGYIPPLVKPIKPIEDLQEYLPASPIHVEFEKTKEGSGGRQGQMQDYVYLSNEFMGKDDQEEKMEENGVQEFVIPSAPKKTVSIKEGAEEIEMPKKKKNVGKGNMKQVTEAEKDSSTKAPKPLKPILKVPSNINEKSEAFIRQRKESLRSYSNTNTDSRSYY